MRASGILRRIQSFSAMAGWIFTSVLLIASGTAQTSKYISIDMPCSSAPPFNCPNGVSKRTAAGEINSAGDIVGVYTDGVGMQHGFLLSRGQFTTIDVPGSLVGADGALPTTARAIGPSGDIVGQFTAPYNPPVSTSAPIDSAVYCPATGSPACIKGFLYSHGKFSAVMFPGHPGAIPGHISPDGSIYGCMHDFDLMDSMFSAGWIRAGDTIVPTSLTAGGGALSDPNQSYPNSMHGGATPDGSVVTGFYVDMTTNHTHGYVIQNGILETYDVPGSTRTVVWDINPGQQMVGTYSDSKGQHGFLQLPDAFAPITVDAPSAAPFNSVSTVIQGINSGGEMVGQYTDTSGHTHGLLVIPE
jgi:hypothetical protein